MLIDCDAATLSINRQRKARSNAFPDWVPAAVRAYMAHTVAGQSIRALARAGGCHASTISRQVRRTEQRRDDLLVDLALSRLEKTGRASSAGTTSKGTADMNVATKIESIVVDDETLEREAVRILRRMNEPGACLAIARNMEKAVVVRDSDDGSSLRTAVVDTPVAEAFALKDWIEATGGGRIIRYRITQPGRMALKRLLTKQEARRMAEPDVTDAFGAQQRDMDSRDVKEGGKRRRVRYSTMESPLVLLSRRKDKSGKPFLTNDLVSAGERLREDFELAQMGPRTTQNWEKFMTAGVRGGLAAGSGGGGGSEAARDRVSKALADLGPGLGDVVLRSCCFLEGMESVEERMGWSARSGKIVLRIALTRLKRHYDESEGGWSPMIG